MMSMDNSLIEEWIQKIHPEEKDEINQINNSL